MKLIRNKFVFSAVVALLACAGLASAQETTSGSIAGQVLDTQGAAMPGATVTITSAQGTKTYVTDANGRFFAPFLTPGQYGLRVELTGFSPVERKGIDVRLGQRVSLDFTLKVGQISETVEVVGAAPVVDTSSTTAGSVLDSDQLRMLPVGRNMTDTLYLVPGVSSSGRVGTANPAIGGGSGLENNYVVDGVNITNTGYGAIGSYSIVFGSLGNGVTTDFIKETQVKTAGFEAEYGQATGGVVNVVTKSGTNDFHGSVYGNFRLGSLESEWKNLQTPNGTVNTTETEFNDFGINLGLPLMKDKLFLFGAFNPQYQTRTLVAPDGFPLESLGETDRKRKIYSYAGKLTWQASANHRVDVSVYGDPSKGDMGPQRAAAMVGRNTAGFSEISSYGGHNQVLKYDGVLTNNWLIEASIGRATNKIEEVPSVDEWSVTDATVVPNVVSGGIGFYEVGNDGENIQYSLKSTNIFEAGGNHQFRYGVLYEDISYDNVIQRTGPPILLSNGIQTVTGATVTILPDPVYGRIYRATRANFSNVRPTQQEYLSFFAQDTWQLGKKLTIKAGVRYEQQKLIGSDSPRPAGSLCNANDEFPGQGSGNGAEIPCEVTWDNNWAPRVGFTFDPTGTGKAKIYGSWGRFYAKIPNDLAARALSADAGISRADYFDASLTQPVPEGVNAAGSTRHLIIAGTHAAAFDPDAKSTYKDEFLAGVEWEAIPRLNLGARYIHRNMPRILEDIGTAQFILYDLGVPGLESVEYYITNVNADTPVFPSAPYPQATFEDPDHTYDAIELTANKAFADNWSLLASYRWSKLEGNFEGFFRNDNGQSDPAITSLFDFPTNDPSYTSIGTPLFGYRGDVRYLGSSLGIGPLPNDRPHQIKIYGNYAWTNLNLGMGFNWGSGLPLQEQAANPNYASGGEIPEELRGSGIETVNGFQERADDEITFDVHADYTFNIGGGSQKFLLFVDAFNLFNRQEPTAYDNWTERSFGVPNADFGTAKDGGARFTSYQTPRQIRLGARFEW
ncbi:MAG TPA: TonB-dependent receptor [Vicinamibacteria bacterium]|nr:TonB-dependent receptor [Vicinamibacteria bacterium]